MKIQIITSVFAALALFLALAGASVAQGEGKLSERQKSIVTIAAFTGSGDLDRLKPALTAGLDAGLTVNEIKEVLVHMYAYAGFPRSLNGIVTFIGVMDERKAKGIEDEEGREATPMPSDMDKNAYGAKVRATLVGMEKDITGRSWQTFTPVIDTFLKEHLFADIFARDVLDHQSRELATIGALAAMRGTQPQLRSHLNVSLNVGLTPEQLGDFTEVIETRVGAAEGESATEVLRAVLDARDQ